MGAASEQNLGLALGRSEDLAEVLHVPPRLGVGDGLVEAVEDEEKVSLAVQVQERLRVERLRGEPLKVVGEQALQTDGGRTAFPQIDQDGDAGVPAAVFHLLPGPVGQLAGETLREAGLAAAKIAEQGEEGARGLVQ